MIARNSRSDNPETTALVAIAQASLVTEQARSTAEQWVASSVIEQPDHLDRKGLVTQEPITVAAVVTPEVMGASLVEVEAEASAEVEVADLEEVVVVDNRRP